MRVYVIPKTVVWCTTVNPLVLVFSWTLCLNNAWEVTSFEFLKSTGLNRDRKQETQSNGLTI